MVINSLKMATMLYLIPLCLGLGQFLLERPDVLVQEIILALQREGVIGLQLRDER